MSHLWPQSEPICMSNLTSLLQRNLRTRVTRFGPKVSDKTYQNLIWKTPGFLPFGTKKSGQSNNFRVSYGPLKDVYKWRKISFFLNNSKKHLCLSRVEAICEVADSDESKTNFRLCKRRLLKDSSICSRRYTTHNLKKKPINYFKGVFDTSMQSFRWSIGAFEKYGTVQNVAPHKAGNCVKVWEQKYFISLLKR